MQGKAQDEELQKYVVVEDIVLKPYPNPVVDTLTLPDYDYWQVYNLSGQQVQSGTGDAIDMTSLSRGIYFVVQLGNTHTIVKN